jgi:hypothetical protein
MGHIYMNGEPTTLENIFDAVNPGRPDLWCYVSDDDIGRKIHDVLDEWVNQSSTYFFVKGRKTTFELK